MLKQTIMFKKMAGKKLFFFICCILVTIDSRYVVWEQLLQ